MNTARIALPLALALAAVATQGCRKAPLTEPVLDGRSVALPPAMTRVLEVYDPQFRPLADERLPASAVAVLGDFNGDGRRDAVFLGRGLGYQALVALVSSDKSFRIIELAREPVASARDRLAWRLRRESPSSTDFVENRASASTRYRWTEERFERTPLNG